MSELPICRYLSDLGGSYEIHKLSAARPHVALTQALFAFLHFAHLAFWAALIRALAAADIVRFRPLLIETTLALAFAHLARCAAAIRA